MDQLADRGGRNDVLAVRLVLLTLSVGVRERPEAGGFIVTALADALAHFDIAAERPNLGRAGLPHHTRAAARIAEGVEQRLDDRAILLRLLRSDGVPDGGAQRQALDPLGGPVGGNLLAAHAPHFFGVSLEKDVEEPLAEL